MTGLGVGRDEPMTDQGDEMDETKNDATMVLLTEKCTERSCQRVRYSELTDAANTHWHVRRGAALVPLSELSS